MKGLSAQQIHLDMKEVLGDDAPLQATVYRWTTAFKSGRHDSQLKTSTVLVARLTHALRKLLILSRI